MMTHEEMLARARQVFDVEVKGLEKTRDSLDESFTKTIDLMLATLDAGGLVVVTGVGKNLHIAEKMSAIFASTGTRSIVLNPVQAMHGDLGMTGPKDLLVALSFAGECGKEACPFGMAPTNSTTATMAMGDALAMVMIDARRFDIKSYAANHPAGAIGRALVMKVTDVMRTGERLATVGPEATVLEALMKMTAAHGGSAAVVDADGKLLGIFTDGDFRRHVSEGRDILHETVSTYMTKGPVFVHDDIYAAELLTVFERKQIDDLPVCDVDGRLVGLVDISDLPKMKVL